MAELVVHPKTKQQLDRLATHASHAVLLTGPKGIGKATLAAFIAEQLLDIPKGSLAKYPHVIFIRSQERKAIGIEQIRELEHFTSLKIPGSKPIARIALIEDAQAMTLEAQNALLKTLEEPPSDTVLILTTAHPHALLPTIRSRVQSVAVTKPARADIEKFFSGLGSEQDRKQALAISGGLPGLMTVLLSKDTEHPLTEAVAVSRELLQAPVFERLLRVDELSKRKEFCQDVCFVLMQMAHTALSTATPATRWQTVLSAAYEAQEQLIANTQPKLVLTNLMLQL